MSRGVSDLAVQAHNTDYAKELSSKIDLEDNNICRLPQARGASPFSHNSHNACRVGFLVAQRFVKKWGGWSKGGVAKRGGSQKGGSKTGGSRPPFWTPPPYQRHIKVGQRAKIEWRMWTCTSKNDHF